MKIKYPLRTEPTNQSKVIVSYVRLSTGVSASQRKFLETVLSSPFIDGIQSLEVIAFLFFEN